MACLSPHDTLQACGNKPPVFENITDNFINHIESKLKQIEPRALNE